MHFLELPDLMEVHKQVSYSLTKTGGRQDMPKMSNEKVMEKSEMKNR